MAHSKMTCCIAGINFEFCNLGADEFNVNFLPFVCPAPVDISSKERCSVTVVGANRALCGQRSDKAWSFKDQDGLATLSAANPDGELLWRMTGHIPYEALTFEWNPDTFFDVYNDEHRGPYGIIAVLALVLRLLYLKGIVLHCSASVVDGVGIICTGRSGQGKSTISAILDKAGIPVLTDERAIIRVEASGLRVYGSPWPSSGEFVLNSSAPLKKIYFIEHGLKNEVIPIAKGEALKRLLDVVMIPWMNSAFFDPVIEVLEKTVGDLSHAVLRFVPDGNVVDFIKADLL